MDTAILGMLGTAVATLAGAIAYLWRQSNESNLRVEKKLEACEESHKETQTTIVCLSRELGELKGKQAGIELLAKQVLEVVKGNESD